MKIIFILLLAIPAWAGTLDSPRADYEAGRYGPAVEALEKIPGADRSAEVQHALGASWFKRGDVGRAIFHFRRAVLLRPRDADAKFNLEFARKGAKDRLPAAGAWIALPFSRKETWVFAAWLCFISGIVGAAWVWRRDRWLSGVSLAGAGLSALALTLAVVSSVSVRPFGVVTAEEARVYSGPGETYTHLFSLHAGAEFDRLGASGPDWLQIKLADGKVGWVPANATVASAASGG